MELATLSKQTAERLLTDYVFGPRDYWAVLRLTGADVRSYLQSQITQDMRRLSAEQGIHACLLSPQGKPISELYLFDRGDTLYMLVPDTRARNVIARLRRFSLGHEFTIESAQTLGVYALQGSLAEQGLRELALPAPADGWLACAQHANGLVAVMPASPRGFWLVAEREWLAHGPIAPRHRIVERELEAMRIIRGLPVFGVEWDEHVHPLNANLIETDGVSFDKGCYVGQEVTSRMRWRGGIRKRLYHVRLAQCPSALPCPIHAADQPIGTLCSAALDPEERCFGIAWLPIATVERGAEFRLSEGASIEVLGGCHC